MADGNLQRELTELKRRRSALISAVRSDAARSARIEVGLAEIPYGKMRDGIVYMCTGLAFLGAGILALSLNPLLGVLAGIAVFGTVIPGMMNVERGTKNNNERRFLEHAQRVDEYVAETSDEALLRIVNGFGNDPDQLSLVFDEPTLRARTAHSDQVRRVLDLAGQDDLLLRTQYGVSVRRSAAELASSSNLVGLSDAESVIGLVSEVVGSEPSKGAGSSTRLRPDGPLRYRDQGGRGDGFDMI